MSDTFSDYRKKKRRLKERFGDAPLLGTAQALTTLSATVERMCSFLKKPTSNSDLLFGHTLAFLGLVLAESAALLGCTREELLYLLQEERGTAISVSLAEHGRPANATQEKTGYSKALRPGGCSLGGCLHDVLDAGDQSSGSTGAIYTHDASLDGIFLWAHESGRSDCD
jgi:hypothetical protein